MNELNQDVSIQISLLDKESICQIEKQVSALNWVIFRVLFFKKCIKEDNI